MKINFEQSPAQIELLKAIGSKDKNISFPAQEALAALISPTIGEIYQQADTTQFLFKDWTFREDEDNSFPLELFANVPEGYFSIWSSPMPGGVPSNTVHQVIEEVKFTTYRLDSAWNILAKYARAARFPIVEKAIERMLQEVLLKTNLAAWSVLLAAVAQAKNVVKGVEYGHVYATQTAGTLGLADYNKMITLFRRMNASWVGGTPVNGASRPTDFIVSPEMMEQFRALAYQPINTAGVGGVTATAATPLVMLPEAERERLYKGAGIPEFYGVNIIELLELGKNQSYQLLFENYIGGTQFPKLGSTTKDQDFDPSTDELVLMVDASRDIGLRAIATDADTGSTFTMEADDQFLKRSGKFGFFGGLEEGRIVLDSKGLSALVV